MSWLTPTDPAVPPITRRDATPEDVPALSQMLAWAFYHDPAHRWLFPTEAAWARHSHRRFAYHLRRTLRRGVVTTTTGWRGAVAVADRPPGIGVGAAGDYPPGAVAYRPPRAAGLTRFSCP